MIPGLVSVVIPARNEPFLHQTIKDLLKKAKEKVEIIVVLDGYWPEDYVTKDNVTYIHFSRSRGMRAAINAGVAIAKGEFILKTDAHCMFAEGYDEVLKKDCRVGIVVVPRRYALDPKNWCIENNAKYPVDYMYLSKELQGEIWKEKNDDPQLKEKPIDDLMSAQGSCWFMRRDFYYWLELMDEETYGKFYKEFQEIAFKVWLSGGRVVVNKETWYAHWHKTKEDGRGYTIDAGEDLKARQAIQEWVTTGGKAWHKQELPFFKMLEKFWPVPTWPLSELK